MTPMWWVGTTFLRVRRMWLRTQTETDRLQWFWSENPEAPPAALFNIDLMVVTVPKPHHDR